MERCGGVVKATDLVWADDFINAQLSTTHKNSAIYAVFSKRLRAKGYSRSISQCRIKAKKLRAEYIKTRDAITKGGADESIKDKFPWYDQMDDILGSKPKVDPVDEVEDEEHEEHEEHSPAPSSSTDPGSYGK
uniref:Myb/SANT-like DNA-binding domain-containing protein n=1 Tax=Neogobius melanostomus TaxID=47308 RepID=A0A8C6U0V0_9GOBI